ncbi:hypothetical protein H6G54_16120 [Anabaena cylindrica FACHB-243]|uniref:Uncharacterized protein n=1 Tax=Anabaena cylindrica (strain ATCC 27899 / PCC 7122) TaxID=272123 RepID=K9ZFN1_ANACC|nr:MULTISPECIES: hypothetical protein [Anabaena]AFZ58028.1 hypothetical protein Anacy_2586 [Anabaena cylindrica PCC 7122]MBD2419197.1 hypothetical protein [Anabaena cylindrica FACHB-243]MBY5285254.1 hypothetical protein [Anabaena sp. CCAP 1446/1C]MBY5311517.1 hypothetical protein [Anabaena sp. CCAP 1446/1C]MCM2409669.1 hypothetical protein [Anabaena sp. CCAP 1446/1C]
MKVNSANIIAQLKIATENLNYSCAGDSSVGTRIWELTAKGELSLENMFKLLPIDVDWMEGIYTRCEYLVKAESNYQTVILDEEICISGLYQIYLQFFESLLSNLSDLQIYEITIDKTLLHYDYNHTEGSYRRAGGCYIGRTTDGYWIGIANKYPCDFLSSSDEEFLPKSNNLFRETTHKFLQEIPSFMEILYQSSRSHYLASIQGQESGHPNPFYIFNYYFCEVAETKDLLFKKLLYSIGIIATRRFCGTSFPSVDEILRLHLRNLREYIFLGTNYCWIGEAQEGDWIGVTAYCYP